MTPPSTIVRFGKGTGKDTGTRPVLTAQGAVQVRCDNGYVVVLGRGIDLYQPPPKDSRWFVGWHDMFFRPCKACRIEVLHDSSLDHVTGSPSG